MSDPTKESLEQAHELVLKWLLEIDDPPPEMHNPVFSEELIPRLAALLDKVKDERLAEWNRAVGDVAAKAKADERRKVYEEAAQIQGPRMTPRQEPIVWLKDLRRICGLEGE